jgi:ATP-dependent helicase/nuclease subunit A
MESPCSDATAGPWHAIQAEVPSKASLLAATGPLPSRASLHACGIVQSLAAAMRKPRPPRPDGTPEPPAWLVAPSRRVGLQWVETLVRSGHPVVNLQITTISALAFNVIAAKLSTESLLVASPRAKVAIIERLLRAHAATFESLSGAVVSTRRLAERVLHSVEALRMAGLGPGQVGAALAGQAKGRDLDTLMREYEYELTRLNLIDQASQLVRAAEIIRGGDAPPNIERILVPSDLDLPKCERDLLASCRLAKNITVEDLVSDGPLPEHRPAATPAREKSPHASSREPASAAWGAKFFQAVGEANEVRHVLRTCLARGFRLDEVELIHTDGSTYPPLIHEIIAALPQTEEVEPAEDGTPQPITATPVTFSEGLPVRDSKPGRALLAWLRWRREGYPQSGLERMLREGLLKIPAPKAVAKKPEKSFTSASALIWALRSLRVGRGLERLCTRASDDLARTKDMTLQDFAAQHGDENRDEETPADAELEAARQRRATTLETLVTLSEQVRACEPAADQTLGTAAPRALLERAHHFLDKLCTSRSEFDANARNRLMEEIGEAIQCLDHDPGSGLDDIAMWLEQLPSELVVMGAGPRPGCLYVSPIASGGHSGRPYTFIIGLDEDRFPGGETDDPVLTDGDRARLNASHPDAGLTEARGAARRNFDAWWSLLARLGGQVFLGFSCRDTEEGAEMFPSPALLALSARIRGSVNMKASEFIAGLGKPEAYVPQDAALALDETQARLALLGPKASAEARSSAVLAHRDHLTFGHHAEAARRRDAFTAYDGAVPDAGHVLDPCAPDGREASPHSLETLGACPRRFFFRYGLEIRPPEPPLDDCDRWLGPLEAGTALHAILEKFVRRLIERGDTPRADHAQTAEMEEILDAELAEWRHRTPPVTEIAFDSTRHELAAALKTFLSDEERLYAQTRMRPIAIEAAIGLAPSEPGTSFDSLDPVAVDLPGGKQLKLRGRIDRVDYLNDERHGRIYALWDYKSGSSYSFPDVGASDPFDQGRKLQHGLYVLMLRARLNQDPEAATAGRVERFGYFFPSRSGKGIRLEWSADRLANCADLVAKLAEIARRGAFLPTMAKSDCTYCKFTPVCGDPAAIARQASRMAAASPVLKELFDGLTSSSRTIATPERYRVTNAPLALVPHTQGPTKPSDERERHRIRTDLETNLFVEAAAGTGKTTCIVDRLLGLIRTGKAKPQAIVAVTFTRKAAGELRRRFREELHAQVANTEAPDERARLTEAIAHAESMVIGTIHSFAARLLRERAVDAGVDPAFTELDDAADRLLREQAWRMFAEAAPFSHPAIINRLESVGLRLGDLHFAFVNKFADYGDVTSWPAPAAPQPNIKAALTSLDPFVTKIRHASFPPEAARGTDELMNDLEQFVRLHDRTDKTSTVTVMDLLQTLDREPKLVQEYWPGAKDADKERSKAAKEAAKQWKQEWDDVRQTIAAPHLWEWRAHCYPTVIEVLLAARERYDLLRQERGVLSFQDLLSKTGDLLKACPEAREDFRSRYTHILVDEFQDTDPIQAEMLLLLCATDYKEKDALNCVPVPGSLFVVGDPKQSLYRFRRADIVTYNRVKQVFKSHGAILELTTNFRSRSDLVAFANAMFSSEFPSVATTASPAFVPATSGRRDAPPPPADPATAWLSGVRALRYARSGYEGEEWVVEEAHTIAEFIIGAIKGGHCVPRTESERAAGIPFECSAKDFLIVARERAHLSIYAAALQAAGLAVDITGAFGADHADSLRALRGCLAAVADPDDPVAILSLLRGPVFGLSDADLFEYRQAGGSFYGGIDVPDSCPPDLRNRCAEAKSALRRWRGWAGRLSVASAVEKIIDDAGLLLVASCQGETGPGGRAVVGLVQKYLESIRRSRETILSIQDCLDAMDDLLDSDTKTQFDPLAIDPETDDRVRLMNLHKAKGLEAPVVFLGDFQVRPLGDKPENGPALHVDRTTTPPQGWLSVMRTTGRAKQIIAAPTNWPTIWQRELDFEAAERTRVDYVAATRPGTALVVSQFGEVKKATKRPPKPEEFNPKGAWERFGRHLASSPDLPPASPPPGAAAGAADEVIPRGAAADSALLRREITGRIAALAEPTFARMSPREVLTESAEGLRYTGKGRGEEWGRVIHQLLELASRMPQCNIEQTARTVLSAEGVPLAFLSDAVALVREIKSSELWRESHAGPRSFAEVPFSIQVAGESLGDEARAAAGLTGPPVPTVIRGVIDRVFEDHDTRWRVIDWKTDAVADSSRTKLDEHYRPQVGLYAQCWRLILDHSQAT